MLEDNNAPGHGPHMGGGVSDESDDDGVERKMVPLNLKTRGLFMFFTPLSHFRFFRKLKYYLQQKEVVANLSPT